MDQTPNFAVDTARLGWIPGLGVCALWRQWGVLLRPASPPLVMMLAMMVMRW